MTAFDFKRWCRENGLKQSMMRALEKNDRDTRWPKYKIQGTIQDTRWPKCFNLYLTSKSVNNSFRPPKY